MSFDEGIALLNAIANKELGIKKKRKTSIKEKIGLFNARAEFKHRVIDALLKEGINVGKFEQPYANIHFIKKVAQLDTRRLAKWQRAILIDYNAEGTKYKKYMKLKKDVSQPNMTREMLN